MRNGDELRQLAERQLGLVSRAQVGRLGGRWDRLTTSGDWHVLTERVARLAGAPCVAGTSVMVAILDEGPGAALSHAAGASWWGLGGFSLRRIELCRVGGRDRHTELARVHEVRSLPDHWVTVHRCIPIVRPELLMMQLCATVHPDRAARALDNAWRERLLSGPSLRAFVDDHAARGRNGIALLRVLLGERGDGYVPPASNLEARVHALFVGTPIRLRRQVDLGGGVWTGRVDFAATDRPLIIEVQSEKYHSSLLDRTHDEARIAAPRFCHVRSAKSGRFRVTERKKGVSG